MYTILHQILTIASASWAPPRPSCGAYDAPHTYCLHASGNAGVKRNFFRTFRACGYPARTFE